MAEKVEVVITIPKYYLTHPQDYNCLAECVRRGIPLPKGHGRLGDLDKALVLINQQIDEHDNMMAKYEPYRNTQIPGWMWEGGICHQLTLIEADREQE